MPVGYQVIFRAEDDRVLAPDAARRRAFSRTILRIGQGHGLFAFGLADTHGHVGLASDASHAGRFCHDARIALASALGVELVPAVTRPLRDTWHLESSIGYFHRQDQHHGAALDPSREGTSLPDLFGLRVIGSFLPERVRALAPRLRRTGLLAHWGVPELDEGFDLEGLGDAGAAAVGLPSLAGRAEAVVAARRACVHCANGTATTEEVANALDVAPRTVRDLRAAMPDVRLVRAVKLQMGLRARVGTAEPYFAAGPSMSPAAFERR